MSYYFKGIRCIKCGHVMDPSEAFDGCPVCGSSTASVNAETFYDFGNDKEKLAKEFSPSAFGATGNFCPSSRIPK